MYKTEVLVRLEEKKLRSSHCERFLAGEGKLKSNEEGESRPRVSGAPGGVRPVRGVRKKKKTWERHPPNVHPSGVLGERALGVKKGNL